MLPHPPKFTGIFSASVQDSRGEMSLCFLSLQTQGSRAKIARHITYLFALFFF